MNKNSLRAEVLARVVSVCQEQELHKHLTNDLQNNSYTYETYGKVVEKPVFYHIQSLLSDLPLEVREAKNKNQFPDIQIYYEGQELLGIDVKAANRLRLDNDQWKPVSRPANDLATFDSMPKKLDRWGGENIWFIFLEYVALPEVQSIHRIVFDKFYTFVGTAQDGLMSYRKKDGKIRPKKFDEPPPYPTLESFEEGLALTIDPWRERIIRQHFALLSSQGKQNLLLELQNE